MGLFSKDQQQDDAAEPAFKSRAEEESSAVRKPRERKARAGNASNDAVLPEKKRARRRLIGAIALVVAIVIGLPMVLDSEPKPLADDISLVIPSKSASAASAAPLPAAPSVNSTLDQKEEVVDTGKVTTVDADKGVATASAQVAPAVGVAAAKSDIKPEAKPEQRPDPKPEVKADLKTDLKAELKAEPKQDAAAQNKPVAPVKPATPAVDEAARARAILEGKDVKPAEQKAAAKPAEAVNTNGKIVLQVASLATQAKINETLGKLKDAGIQSYTQKIVVAAGELTRIRIAANSKEEADKLQVKLKQIGLNGTVIAPGH